MRYPRTIGVLADSHCGSKYGLMSPRNEDHKINVGGRWLHERIMRLADEWPPLDLLVLAGDVIDGEQRKSAGTPLWTSKLSGQVEIAKEVVEDFVEVNQTREIARVDGTEYHEGLHGALADFDTHFGIPKSMRGLFLNIKLAGGALLNVKHKPDGGGTLYKGTAVERDALWAIIAETLRGVPKASHVFRAHIHFYYLAHAHEKTMVFVPCWKHPDPHAIQNGFYRWQPMYGGVLMTRDANARGGYAVREYTYDSPQQKVVQCVRVGNRKTTAAQRARRRREEEEAAGEQ